MKRRTRDVIDVNLWWGAWSGSRAYGFLVGLVQAPDYRSALTAADAQWPDRGVRYVELRS